MTGNPEHWNKFWWQSHMREPLQAKLLYTKTVSYDILKVQQAKSFEEEGNKVG